MYEKNGKIYIDQHTECTELKGWSKYTIYKDRQKERLDLEA